MVAAPIPPTDKLLQVVFLGAALPLMPLEARSEVACALNLLVNIETIFLIDIVSIDIYTQLGEEGIAMVVVVGYVMRPMSIEGKAKVRYF